MKTYFLAVIGGQLFGLAKESVAGVGVRNHSKVPPMEENSQQFLPLPDGNQAAILDLQSSMAGGETFRAPQSHYLIVNHQGQYLALVMTGKGRLVMVDDTGVQALPPAFSGPSKTIIAGVLVNCNDLILQIDLDGLINMPAWAASREKR
jgi:hypothetical protein